MNYYIADTHFSHKNVIHLDSRPFSDIDEMEKVMTENWNNAVSNEDTVYILGDFCWKRVEEWMRILSNLNGNKVLIRGNHDIQNMPPELSSMFTDVSDYMEIEDGKRRVIMCHYPIPFYKKSHSKRSHMLCGHVHTTEENACLEHLCKLIRGKRSLAENQNRGLNYGKIYNVGAMMPWIGYTPRTLNEIVTAWDRAHSEVAVGKASEVYETSAEDVSNKTE